MGQANTVFGITLDKIETLAGDELSGYVWLKHPSADESQRNPSIELRLVGYEKSICAIQASSIDNDHHSSTPYVAFEKKEFISQSYRLKVDQKEISAGRTQVPFCLVIPRCLPPSLTASLGGSNGGECEVSYYLEAEVKLCDNNGKIRKQETTTAPFHVKCCSKSSVLALSRPVATPLRLFELALFDFWSQGNVLLGLHVSSSVLYADVPFDVTYFIKLCPVIENSSSWCSAAPSSPVTIRGVEISLLEIVSWKAQSVKREATRRLFHTRLEGDRIKFVDDSHCEGILTPSQEDLNQLAETRRCTIEGMIEPNQLIRGMMKSDLIQVRYALHMKVYTQMGVNNPEMFLPIMVYATTSNPPVGGECETISSIDRMQIAQMLGYGGSSVLLSDPDCSLDKNDQYQADDAISAPSTSATTSVANVALLLCNDDEV